MSRQIGSLNRSLSYQSNLQCHSSRMSLSDLTSSPLPSFTSNSLRMGSDDFTNTVLAPSHNSIIPILTPQPVHFFATPFRPLHTLTPNKTSPAPSSYTEATPVFSPMKNDQPEPSSPVNEELEHELDNFITLQQLLQNTKALIIHHLSQSIYSSESSNPASTVAETRAHRVFKRKHPTTQTLHHPDCFPFTRNTLMLKKFFKYNLRFFHNIPTITLMTSNLIL